MPTSHLRIITKYYLIQLFVGLITPIVILNAYTYINNSDDYVKGRLFLLSIVAGLMVMAGNAVINALNFIHIKYKKFNLAFIIPIVIWFSLMLLNKEFTFIIAFSQAIIYNILLLFYFKKINY